MCHIQFFNFSRSRGSSRLDVKDDRQILLLLLSEFKKNNELLNHENTRGEMLKSTKITNYMYQ